MEEREGPGSERTYTEDLLLVKRRRTWGEPPRLRGRLLGEGVADHSQQHPRQGLKEQGSALPPGFRAPAVEGTSPWGLASQLSSLLGLGTVGEDLLLPRGSHTLTPSF